MNSSLNIEERRCRPQLGTFLEITARASRNEELSPAFEAAFGAASRVQKLMSFHEETSDVSRLNRLALRRPVEVSAWTFEVIAAALEMSRLSKGAFDITVASTLMSWGLLPCPRVHHRNQSGTWRDIQLLPHCRVRFRRPLTVDLGGIAKGFAVDKAVEALQSRGVLSGMVNAGGDLRVFGSRSTSIHLRHPASPGYLLPVLQLSDEAVATSAPCFSIRCRRGRRVSHLVNPRTREPFTAPLSISVRAPRCLLADALTKVVLADPDSAGEVLTEFNASAVILSA